MRYKIKICYSLEFPRFPNSRVWRVKIITIRGPPQSKKEVYITSLIVFIST